MARLHYIIVAFVVLLAFVNGQIQGDDNFPQSLTTSHPIPTTSYRASESKHREMQRHGSDPPSSSSRRFLESMKSLSGTKFRHWFHQSYQAVTYTCSYVVNYPGRIYRYLQLVREHEREERARWNRLTVGYDAARRAAIGESPQKESEVAALCTARTTLDISVFKNQSAERMRKKMARAGLRLDDVPYPALWLEGLVRSTEGLPSLPGWWARFWGMEWPDVVSWLSRLSPFSWWARSWKWFWRQLISWSLMTVFLIAQALYLRVQLGPEVACLFLLGQAIMLCYIFGWM